MSNESKTDPDKKPAEPSILAFDKMIAAKCETQIFDITKDEDREAYISLTQKPRRMEYHGKTFIISDGGNAGIPGFPNKRTVDMV